MKCRKGDCVSVRRYLRELVQVSEDVLTAIDKIMQEPSDAKRGARIAAACNALELQKDIAKRFGLGVKFKGEK